MDTDIDRLVDKLIVCPYCGMSTWVDDRCALPGCEGHDLPCPTCGGTGQITRPHPHDHAYMPRRPITYRCPNCTDRKPT